MDFSAADSKSTSTTTMSSTQQILILRVFLGEREIEQRPFTRDHVVLGRDPYADIYLEDPSVSRVHATIVRNGDGFQLMDNSSNGTMFNGDRVTTAMLRTGDLLKIGRFVVFVELHRDADPIVKAALRPGSWDSDFERTVSSAGMAKDKP